MPYIAVEKWCLTVLLAALEKRNDCKTDIPPLVMTHFGGRLPATVLGAIGQYVGGSCRYAGLFKPCFDGYEERESDFECEFGWPDQLHMAMEGTDSDMMYYSTRGGLR